MTFVLLGIIVLHADESEGKKVLKPVNRALSRSVIDARDSKQLGLLGARRCHSVDNRLLLCDVHAVVGCRAIPYRRK